MSDSESISSSDQSDSDYESPVVNQMQTLAIEPPKPVEVASKPAKAPKAKSNRIGTREQVWSGECLMTVGGLTKERLFWDEKAKKVKSRSASDQAKAKAAKAKESNTSVFAPKAAVKAAVEKIESQVTATATSVEPKKRGRPAKAKVPEPTPVPEPVMAAPKPKSKKRV